MATDPALTHAVLARPDFGVRDSSTSEYFKAAHIGFVKCKNAANISALQAAIAFWQSALASINDITNPKMKDCQSRLAKALLLRFNHIGHKDDESTVKVENPAEAMRDALDLFTSYCASLDLENLKTATSLYKKALAATAISHEEHWISLLELSDLILLQSHSTNDLLNETLLHMKKAIGMQPLLSMCWAAVLLTAAQAGLSEDLLDQTFQVLMKASREDEIALKSQQAGEALYEKFQQSGDLQNLNECVAHLEQTLAQLSWRHPSRAYALGTLGEMLSVRFRCNKGPEDLDKSIKGFEKALELQPAPHPNFVLLLVNLALGLQTKFEQQADNEALEKAIAYFKEAFEYSSDPEMQSIILNNLATAYTARFKTMSEPTDLDESIKLMKQTLSLRPSGHSDRGLALSNLATVIQHRFNLTENFDDVEEVVLLCREALTLHPISDPCRIQTLDHLANGLRSRFEQLETFDDLEEAIQLHQEAVDLFGSNTQLNRRQGSPIIDSASDHSTALLNLASAVQVRFMHHGDIKDLDKVVETYRKALDVCVPHNECECTENLAGGLQLRFERNGHIKDLEEAITLHKEARKLTPVGHFARSTIAFNLARALRSLFEKRGNKNDLEEAVKLHEEDLTLSPPSHPNRKTSLTSFANTLLTKLEYDRDFHAPVKQETDGKESQALKKIIELQREALTLFPASHAGRSDALNNLSNALHVQFTWHRDSQALEESVCLYKEALELRPPPHSRRGGSLAALASVLAARYKHNHSPYDLVDSIFHVQEASEYLYSTPLNRIEYTHVWGQIAAEFNHFSALSAYQKAIDLLPQIAALHLDVVSRQSILSVLQASQLASEAAVCAINKQDFSAAVELLEASRSVFWSQAMQLQTPISHLEHTHMLAMEAEGAKYEELNKDWNATIEAVRQLPNFEDFMQHKKISALSQAAVSGPIIILITRSSICYALIVTQREPVQCILLSQVNTETGKFLASLSLALSRSNIKAAELLAENAYRNELIDSKVHELQGRLFGGPEGLMDVTSDDIFENLLAELWTSIKTNHPRRLWWCPTGSLSFLPLHAAGIYGKTETDSLDGSMEELYAIQKRVPNGWLTSLGDSSPAMVDAALYHLRESSIVHFACHGAQDLENPLDSSLILSDGPIRVSDIMREGHDSSSKNMAKGLSLAFLSACETAKGDTKTPDEAMHLAATLLFAGFRSVVATMWEMIDEDGPQIADEFYTQLFKGCNPNSNPPIVPDLANSAKALHYAVIELRKCQGMTFRRWVPFVHYGL
ncbi:CHAT domain-containing protein [Mycena rebaudengoi]|nr:CHAT domain-containing protein [Mycena rebaudengoi]